MRKSGLVGDISLEGASDGEVPEPPKCDTSFGAFTTDIALKLGYGGCALANRASSKRRRRPRQQRWQTQIPPNPGSSPVKNPVPDQATDRTRTRPGPSDLAAALIGENDGHTRAGGGVALRDAPVLEHGSSKWAVG